MQRWFVGCAAIADIPVAMPLNDRYDPVMNERREPMSAWERGLRPASSSNRMLLVTLVVATALVALALAQGWLVLPGPRPSQAQRGAPPAPVVPASTPSDVPPSELAATPGIQH